MDNMIRIDKDYVEWLKHVKKRFKNTQIKASIKVNDELLRFYWSIGKDIVNMQAESKWGGAFFETLSEDLKKMFPGAKGFSTTNLRYMKRYYNLFGEILPPTWGRITGGYKSASSWGRNICHSMGTYKINC